MVSSMMIIYLVLCLMSLTCIGADGGAYPGDTNYPKCLPVSAVFLRPDLPGSIKQNLHQFSPRGSFASKTWITSPTGWQIMANTYDSNSIYIINNGGEALNKNFVSIDYHHADTSKGNTGWFWLDKSELCHFDGVSIDQVDGGKVYNVRRFG